MHFLLLPCYYSKATPRNQPIALYKKLPAHVNVKVLLQTLFCSCVVVATSVKNGSSFSRVFRRRAISYMSTRQKYSENTKKAAKLSLIVFCPCILSTCEREGSG